VYPEPKPNRVETPYGATAITCRTHPPTSLTMYAYVAPSLYEAFIGFAAESTTLMLPKTRATPVGRSKPAARPTALSVLLEEPDPAMTVNVYDVLNAGSGMDAISTLYL
jgi:hypothetical protein